MKTGRPGRTTCADERLFAGAGIILWPLHGVGNIFDSVASFVFCVWPIVVMMGVKVFATNMPVANKGLPRIYA